MCVLTQCLRTCGPLAIWPAFLSLQSVLYLIRHTATSCGHWSLSAVAICISSTPLSKPEFSLVKVANDILLNINSQRVTLLALLDLSAALGIVPELKSSE